MKIKKIYNGVVPNGKILNSKNTSQNDTYSCNYINDKSDALEENINSLNNIIKQTPIYEEIASFDIENGSSNSVVIPLGGYGRAGLAYIRMSGNDIDRNLLYFLYYGNRYSYKAVSLVDYKYNTNSANIDITFDRNDSAIVMTIANNSGVDIFVTPNIILFKPNA